MCRYCLIVVCAACMPHESVTRLCVPSHAFVIPSARDAIEEEDDIFFRNRVMKIGECMDVIRQEWGLESVVVHQSND
ncbi:hypothetical protein K504DRAFT_468330 [Pleomassaria siparia CBS 279.74]|uniref:Uncharacterized protein n=1 Tax=Pleomassaria siparia CBS 279.74 TaxID=1314801 RepID=A0A6G1K9T7_9PLEO|nr:hypothetical protein K504DRAFT_468330 [Pleomassaria siparia CBS 279.74]